MNGPEHYREAERLLVLSCEDDADMNWKTHRARVRLAQVHATLALAAAPFADPKWSEVLS